MLLIALALFCLPVAGIAAKFLVDWGKSWWAGRQAGLVSQSVEADNEAKARVSLAAAVQASPNDPNVLRAWAAYLKKYGGAATERVSILKKIANSASATTADKAELAIACVATGAFHEARQIIGALPEDLQDSVPVLEARAALTEASGSREAADALRRRAWQSDVSDPRNRFKLAVLDLKSLVPETRSQAIATLWNIAREKGESGLDAARILASHPSLSRPQADELLELMQANPKAAPYDRYLALSGVLRTQPENRDPLLEKEIAKAANYGVNDLLNLAILLDREREYERLLHLIPMDRALKNRELCIIRLKALAEARHFSELEPLLLKQRDLPISTGYASAMLAHVRLRQGRVSDAMTELNQALQRAAAQKDVETVRRVAGFAEAQGWWDLTSRAYEWLAANEPSLRLAALQGLYTAAAARLDTRGMLDAAERLVGSGSEHSQVLLNLAYLRLLTGSQMESVPTLLARPGGDEDGAGSAASASGTLLKALLFYRYGDIEGVRKAMSTVADWSVLPPGMRAVAAALNQYCGAETIAGDLAAQVRALGLLEEEKALWIMVRGSAATVSR